MTDRNILTKQISDERLRNTRAWAAARLDSLSGAEVIVAAIDEVFALRAQLAASCDEARSDPEYGGCPLERRGVEPPAPQDSAWRLGRIRDIASGVGSYTESQRLDVIFDLCSAEPPVERDARLGRALYERMEHMDPSHESREWAQLTDSEREFYITCAESVVVALNRPGEST